MSEVLLHRDVVIDGINHTAGSTLEVEADRKKELKKLGVLADPTPAAEDSDDEKAKVVLANAEADATKTREAAEADAKEVAAKAKESADAQVAAAKTQAEQIVNAAKEEANKITEAAKAEAEKASKANKPN